MSGSHSALRSWGLLMAAGLGTAGCGALGGWWGGWVGGAVGAVAGLAGPVAVDYLLGRRARGRDAWTAWQRLDAGFTTQSWSMDDGYAALLRPERRIVGFIPRPALVGMVMDWAQDPHRRPVLLLTGAGGVGKTRLALHAASLLTTGSGWLCRQVADGQEATAVSVARSVAGRRPVLLIVDYAETRIELAALLAEVAAQPAGDQRIRVLLLARSAGEWWRQLAVTPAGRALGSTVFGPEVFGGQVLGEEQPAGRKSSASGPVEVTAQVREEQDDETVVREAVPVFAGLIGVPPPEQLTIVFDTAGRPPVLELHAAALLLVLAAASGAEPRVVVSQVLDELIGHEERYWQLAARRTGLATVDLTVLRRAVAVACLVPVRDEDGAASALARVPDLRGPDERRRREIARWLHGLYPPVPVSWLGPLAPDLFTERHVCTQLAASADFADACFQGLDPGQARHALTVLARAARHSPATALLTRALTGNPSELAEPAIAVAVQTGVVLGRVFAQVVREAPPDVNLLARIRDAIPYPTTALAEAAATAADRVAALLPPGGDPATAARALRSAGQRWVDVGQPDKALESIQRAVALYEQLALTDPGRHEPDLAESLVILSDSWSARAPSEESLEPAQRAVALYERLARNDPDRYEPDLVSALNSLGMRWWDLEQPGEALRPAQRAVAISEANPGRYEQELAAGLTNLGVWRWGLGEYDKALEAARRAIPIHERLARRDPDRYESGLAAAIGSLGSIWSELDEPGKALKAAQRALAIYRRLSEANPGLYEQDLAAGLVDLGALQWDLERPDAAAEATGQAVTIYRRLIAAGPGRYERQLADALILHGELWWELEQSDLARAYLWQAMAMYEQLAQADPDRHEAGLATSLTALGLRWSRSDEVGTAVAQLARALRIWQRRGLDDDANDTRQHLRDVRSAHPALADQAWRDSTDSEPPPWLTDP